MKNQKYSVKLTEEQRKELKKFITSTSKKNTPQCKTHAKILLCLDENSENPHTPQQTAAKCKLHKENTYKRTKRLRRKLINHYQQSSSSSSSLPPQS